MGIFKKPLAKTRGRFMSGLRNIFTGKREDIEKTERELEELLYTADVGPQIAEQLMLTLSKLKRPWSLTSVIEVWRQEVLSRLEATTAEEPEQASKPKVILIVGVNGVGKTTSTAKLAAWYRNQGKSVLLAAADTFRAAAVEQLDVWAKRLDIDCIRGQEGGDAAAVAFDAASAAKARGVDILIIDSAGRLHTNQNLLQTLKKIKRTVNNVMDRDLDEVLLVLDANTGQNSIAQAENFHRDIGVDGLILTKLDSTAKGGALIGIVSKLNLPVRFVGTGESIEDLQPFDSRAFVEALFEIEGNA